MQIKPLRLPGTFEIIPTLRQDERGYFTRTYDINIWREYGLTEAWLQENESLSVQKGTLRGLHFQRPPYAETKLVRVVTGAILDVFVDLRCGSPTYGQWDSIELSGKNHRMAYIPRGFAHGFCSLTDNAMLLYKVDNFYSAEAEGGLHWKDQTLNIAWPDGEHILSAKDSSLGGWETFDSSFNYCHTNPHPPAPSPEASGEGARGEGELTSKPRERGWGEVKI